MKLGGVIYLHSISETKMRGATNKNLGVFQRLCGDKALARVVLGTTNWGEVNKERGEVRERQLATTFWKTMIDSGSKMLRFDDTKESARAFLNAILGQLKFDENGEIKNDIALRIQKELVELDRSIPETAASQKLRSTPKKKESNSDESDKAAPKFIEERIAELYVSRRRLLKIFVSRQRFSTFMANFTFGSVYEIIHFKLVILVKFVLLLLRYDIILKHAHERLLCLF